MAKKDAEATRAARTAALLESQKKAERRRNVVVVGAVVAVLALVLGVGFLISTRVDTSGEKADATPSGLADGFGIVWGDPDAPKTITIYEDFQCPVCQVFESATSEKLAAAVEAGEVKVDYRLVSFLDAQSTNAFSSRALNAAFVVHEKSGVDVWKTFHDSIFANQPKEGGPGLTDDELIAFAVDAGADQDEIEDPIRDKIFAQFIVNATDQMSKNGVNGTPTAFIDGTLAGNTPAETAQAVLDALK